MLMFMDHSSFVEALTDFSCAARDLPAAITAPCNQGDGASSLALPTQHIPTAGALGATRS